MAQLDGSRTALVLIDLQQGIVGRPTVPHDSGDVLAASIRLIGAARAAGALVVFVRVGWSDDWGDAPSQPVDQPGPARTAPPPAAFISFAEGIVPQPGDISIIKRQWGAFHGTELDLQLRRRGIDTIVLAGVASDIGVESTARFGWELGYSLVIVEDATSGYDADQHRASFTKIFPRIARVRSTEAVLAMLGVELV